MRLSLSSFGNTRFFKRLPGFVRNRTGAVFAVRRGQQGGLVHPGQFFQKTPLPGRRFLDRLPAAVQIHPGHDGKQGVTQTAAGRAGPGLDAHARLARNLGGNHAFKIVFVHDQLAQDALVVPVHIEVSAQNGSGVVEGENLVAEKGRALLQPIGDHGQVVQGRFEALEEQSDLLRTAAHVAGRHVADRPGDQEERAAEVGEGVGVIEPGLAEVARVELEAALAAAEQDLRVGAFPGHHEGEGRHLGELDDRVDAQTAFGRPAGGIVSRAEALGDRDGLAALGVHPEFLERVETEQALHDARVVRHAERIGRLQEIAQGVQQEVPEFRLVRGVRIDFGIGPQAREQAGRLLRGQAAPAQAAQDRFEIDQQSAALRPAAARSFPQPSQGLFQTGGVHGGVEIKGHDAHGRTAVRRGA